MSTAQNLKLLLKNKLFVASLVLVLVAGVSFYALQRYSPNHAVASGEVAIVQLGKDAFLPSTLVIQRGTTVRWVNTNDRPLRLVSGPYPTHDSLASLDSKQAIGTGDDYSYTFTKKGTYTYLNYLQPTLEGSVIVQ